MKDRPIEILLAEDNDDDIVMIREAFEGSKLTLQLNVVRNGQEALDYLRQRGTYRNAPRPGLVLLDINMPVRDGFEVLDDIKGDPRLAMLPVVMLTSSEREDDIVRAYSGGACSYIAKPLTLDEFQSVIQWFELYWTLVSHVPAAP
jgi:CheY-like chemotaxis protein